MKSIITILSLLIAISLFGSDTDYPVFDKIGSTSSIKSSNKYRGSILNYNVSFGVGTYNAVGDLKDNKRLYTIEFQSTVIYNLDETYSLRSGIRLSTKGYRVKTDAEAYSQAYKNKFQYLIIPVLAQINVGFSDYIYVHAGPYFGILLNATRTGTFTNDGQSGEFEIDEKIDGLKKLDYGLDFGFGFQIPLLERARKTSFSLIADFDYHAGLSHVFETTNFEIKNRGLGLQVGIRITP